MKIVAVLFPAERAVGNPDVELCAENSLGLKDWLAAKGHDFIGLTDAGAGLDKLLPTTDVLITTPFWPAYVTRERITAARNLRLIITAGVGSDHVDLAAAAERGITAAEITGSNVVSVAESTVALILALMKNLDTAHKNAVEGGWDIAELTAKSLDLEDKVVGLFGMGRIGYRVALRLKPFDVRTLYHDIRRLSTAEEQLAGIRYASFDELISQSDVVSIHSPLTPATRGLFNRDVLFRMKKGAHLVNTARGAIVDTEALVDALEKGHLAGYAGDVWYPQPAPRDHPWRRASKALMIPHITGASLDAQRRIARGVREILECFLAGQPIHPDHLIVHAGKIVSPSYRYAYEK